MNFEFIPYTGINNLKFGMKREVVRQLLGIDNFSKEFFRSALSKNATDAFNQIGIIVNYDSEDKCDAFEFFDTAQVIWNNEELLSKSYKQFVEYIKGFDKNLEEDESGCTSYTLGIGAYAPLKEDDPNEKIESIIVFTKDYYT